VQRPVTCWAKEVAQWNDWHTVLADTDLTTSSSSSSSSSVGATSATAAAAASSDLSTATPPQAVVAAALLSPEPLSSSTTTSSKATNKSSKNSSKNSKTAVLVTRPKSRNFEARYWRWNGWLCRYAVGGRVDDASAPAIVLVHGFGASADQWDRCFAELGASHRVYAVDMIGFGHSSKPPLTFRCVLFVLIVCIEGSTRVVQHIVLRCSSSVLYKGGRAC
jgi:Alpha/beta hydrolase family